VRGGASPERHDPPARERRDGRTISSTEAWKTGWPGGIIVALLPTIVVYLFMNRRIIAGITAGAVKG